MQALRGRLGHIFGLDLRSVALFRIFYSLVVICDLIGRMSPFELSAFYTDDGVFPRELLFRGENIYYIQIHGMSGRLSFQYLVMFVHLAVLFCLLVGFYTKTAAVLNFLLYTSLIGRNPFISYGGITLLRITAFWVILLPVERVFTLDAAFKDDHSKPRAERTTYLEVSGVTMGYLLEIVALYFTSGAHKYAPEWREDYTAGFYALSLSAFRSRLGEWLVQFPEALKWMTFVTVKWELVGPWLFIFPLFTEWARVIAILGFFSMHLGFHCAMHLSLFIYAFGAVLTCFLPSMVWDKWIMPKLRSPMRSKLRIQYSPSAPSLARLAQVLSAVLLSETSISHLPPVEESEEDGQARRYTLSDLWRVTDARGSHYTGAESISVVLFHSPLLSILSFATSLGFIADRINRWMEAACAKEELFSRKQLQSKRATAAAQALGRTERRIFKAAHFSVTSFLGALVGIMLFSACMWNIGSTVRP